MMTGQPYKSPEQPAEAAAAGETTTKSDDDGTPSIAVENDNDHVQPSSSSTAGAFGVSTISAKLKRQRLANQVYKDAWLATEPTLQGSITPSALLWKVAPAVPGLVVNEEDIAELVDPGDAERLITCEFVVVFACRVCDSLGECVLC